ncbi:MAG: hypothetical protein VR64_15945 [Desulfatitalea sp. BRH_c12]|nr:MAG: hypothetical protein VR64_15945 [Desulfatitalea sp. BRH_c12]
MTAKPLQVVIVLFIAAALAACGGEIEPGTTAPAEHAAIAVPVAEARISEAHSFYEAVATINARNASTISAKLMGAVQAVHVNEGDVVKKGDRLVSIDPSTVNAQLAQAEAALREARRAETSAVSARDATAAAADLAEATYRRYKQLLADQSVSRQEYDEMASRSRQARAAEAQAEAMIAAARSRVQQAQAAARQATLAKKDAQVLAPYDGLVVGKMIEEGDLAAPGTPLLTVEQDGVFCADLVLPERHIQAVKVGMPVTVSVPALGGPTVTGKIGRIVPSADVQSRSFEIKVSMPEGSDFKSGMFARVFIPVGGTGILRVPAAAVVREGQLSGVFVVDRDQIARLRLVRTGKTYEDQVEIVSGLQEGQRYVAAVPPTLKDGMPVEVR